MHLVGSVHPSGCLYTLFSKRSAHESRPNFLRSLGHWPRPRVISLLSNGLESNSQKTRGLLHIAVKTIWQNQHDPTSGSVTQGHRENNVHFFWRRVYINTRMDGQTLPDALSPFFTKLCSWWILNTSALPMGFPSGLSRIQIDDIVACQRGGVSD